MVGLGSDQGEKRPKPERERDLASGSGPKRAVLGTGQGQMDRSWAVLGPRRSVLEGDQAGKWPKPEREDLSGEGTVFPRFQAPKAGTNFSFRYEKCRL